MFAKVDVVRKYLGPLYFMCGLEHKLAYKQQTVNMYIKLLIYIYQPIILCVLNALIQHS
jgi:hypothetical protein